MVLPLNNVDVDDLVSTLRRSVSANLTETAPSSAVTFAPCAQPGDLGRIVAVDGGPVERRRLDPSLATVRSLALSIGSLPPSPPTLRGRVGRVLLRFANRLTWWQGSLLRQLAESLGDIGEDLGRSVADLDPRQRNVEHGLDQLRRRSDGFEEVANLIGREIEELRARLDELERRNHVLTERQERL